MSLPVPTVELIAYTEGRPSDSAAERFLRSFEHDSGVMSWTGERPEAFDDVDQGERIVGLTYWFPQPGPWITPTAERQLLAEVRWLLAWLEQISGNLGLVLAIRYDERLVGWIRRGVTDRAVSEDLVAIWERDLERLERDSPRR
jgi:hypothetical protein